ncbi:hypothetical protein QR98_0056870 [Sarcoptes scabiei]|uniref:Uncharacterized protein n=1 Tax=Sarcoptes scabiei TaxID=52283 RepID=A0A132A9S6_SARSC|nr:hypothetical protein QR98_0056870 [Sarcoptes scabiei]
MCPIDLIYEKNNEIFRGRRRRGAKNDEFQLRYTNKQTIPYYLSKLITFDFACLFASLNATK